MPTLEWIGKSAVVKHDNEAPFHLLRCDETLAVDDAGSDELLKVLLVMAHLRELARRYLSRYHI